MVITVKQMETPEEIEGKSLVHWQTWRADLCHDLDQEDGRRLDRLL